jgi:excisionase family DNA binding protein
MLPKTITHSQTYSVSEAAQVLKICTKTVNRMIAEGKLKAAQVTERRKVIPSTEIERLLAI